MRISVQALLDCRRTKIRTAAGLTVVQAEMAAESTAWVRWAAAARAVRAVMAAVARTVVLAALAGRVVEGLGIARNHHKHTFHAHGKSTSCTIPSTRRSSAGAVLPPRLV